MWAYDDKQKRSFCFGGPDNVENDFNKAREMLETMAPPFMVVLNLENEIDKITEIKELLGKRFPGMNISWESSDPGEEWNLEYTLIPPHKH